MKSKSEKYERWSDRVPMLLECLRCQDPNIRNEAEAVVRAMAATFDVKEDDTHNLVWVCAKFLNSVHGLRAKDPKMPHYGPGEYEADLLAIKVAVERFTSRLGGSH